MLVPVVRPIAVPAAGNAEPKFELVPPAAAPAWMFTFKLPEASSWSGEQLPLAMVVGVVLNSPPVIIILVGIATFCEAAASIVAPALPTTLAVQLPPWFAV